MDDDIKFILNVKSQLRDAISDTVRKEIIENVVNHFKEKGYDNDKIIDIFKIDWLNEEQSNTSMTSNNERYLTLLKQILSK